MSPAHRMFVPHIVDMVDWVDIMDMMDMMDMVDKKFTGKNNLTQQFKLKKKTILTKTLV